jgi:hypothetical protein
MQLVEEKNLNKFFYYARQEKAHALLIERISLEENTPTIFHNLAIHFDKSLTQESAEELLFNYRAPKSLSISITRTGEKYYAMG